jgi:hypothetical protein
VNNSPAAQIYLLDGRNRLDAIEVVGGTTVAVRAGYPDCDFRVLQDGDPYDLVVSFNVHRRHLSAEQKRELIEKLLKAKPATSDRQIAKQTKSSPTTVGTVRKSMEKAGDVSKLDTRTDTKGREQPAERKRRITKEEKEFHEKYEARETKMQADWLADHPGTVEDAQIACTCSDTPEGGAAFREWMRKRGYFERDVLDTPMPATEIIAVPISERLFQMQPDVLELCKHSSHWPLLSKNAEKRRDDAVNRLHSAFNDLRNIAGFAARKAEKANETAAIGAKVAA